MYEALGQVVLLIDPRAISLAFGLHDTILPNILFIILKFFFHLSYLAVIVFKVHVSALAEIKCYKNIKQNGGECL